MYPSYVEKLLTLFPAPTAVTLPKLDTVMLCATVISTTGEHMGDAKIRMRRRQDGLYWPDDAADGIVIPIYNGGQIDCVQYTWGRPEQSILCAHAGTTGSNVGPGDYVVLRWQIGVDLDNGRF